MKSFINIKCRSSTKGSPAGKQLYKTGVFRAVDREMGREAGATIKRVATTACSSRIAVGVKDQDTKQSQAVEVKPAIEFTVIPIGIRYKAKS